MVLVSSTSMCGEFQVAAIKDAGQSNQGSGSTSGRLLHLRLTDGHSFLTAIEYRSVPFLSVDVPPGTKVAPILVHLLIP